MEQVFKTIPAILKDDESAVVLREAIVIAAWKRAAGETVSTNAQAISVEEATLKVAVADEVWKIHLEALAGQMIFKVNSILRSPEITFIEFYVDEEAAKKGRRTPERSVPQKVFEREAERCRSEIPAAATEAIKDAELRELFLEAAGNCLARHNLMIERGQIEPDVDITIED